MTKQLSNFLYKVIDVAMESLPEAPWEMEDDWIKDNLAIFPENLKEKLHKNFCYACEDFSGSADAYLYVMDADQWPWSFTEDKQFVKAPLKSVYYALALLDTNKQANLFYIVSTKPLSAQDITSEVVNSEAVYKLGRTTQRSFNDWFKTNYIKKG